MILYLDVTAAGEQIRMSKLSVLHVKNTIVKIVWIHMIYAIAKTATTAVDISLWWSFESAVENKWLSHKWKFEFGGSICLLWTSIAIQLNC